jgi:putative transposase
LTVEFIDANRSDYGVEPICDVLQISPSSYWSKKSRPPSARSVADLMLAGQLREIWEKNFSVYGARKMWKAMRRAGIDVGRDRVARLMRAEGLRGAVPVGKKVFTTRQDRRAGRAPDLVDRKFVAVAPDRLWVTDLTYVPTWSGIAYVSFITDVFSRMIVGWRVASNMRTDMVLESLDMACWFRGARFEDLVCHSDAGSQYTSIRYTERLDEIGARPSIGSVADSYDNALAETVNGSYKTELIRRRGPWRTVDDVELATLGWVHWWNNERLHENLDDIPPTEFEANHYASLGLVA